MDRKLPAGRGKCVYQRGTAVFSCVLVDKQRIETLFVCVFAGFSDGGGGGPPAVLR